MKQYVLKKKSLESNNNADLNKCNIKSGLSEIIAKGNQFNEIESYLNENLIDLKSLYFFEKMFFVGNKPHLQA